MEKRKKIIIVLIVLILAVTGFYFYKSKRNAVKKINLENQNSQGFPIANEGPVSPISGLACDNWNRRPIAVMQPADVTARPAAGFSDADLVFEMPVITASITRLMGVYVCGDPDDVGSMRSARHDYVALAAGLDAIFVHWGRSSIESFMNNLNSGVIDNMNCNGDAGKSAVQYCYRKEGMDRGVDSGYAKFAKLVEGAQDFGYRMENKFSGYPHQGEAPVDQRPTGGNLRVAFAGPFAVEYDYDKDSNSYLRTWGGTADTDRNNGKRLAPKNVVVMIAASEQVEGQYNNVQIGDPWYDTSDSGDAYYYMNGVEAKGTWKKDKSRLDSKLLFYDQYGQEVKFVQGQIWVEILEPGQTLRWTPAT